jgi:hypothetical protein
MVSHPEARLFNLSLSLSFKYSWLVLTCVYIICVSMRVCRYVCTLRVRVCVNPAVLRWRNLEWNESCALRVKPTPTTHHNSSNRPNNWLKISHHHCHHHHHTQVDHTLFAEVAAKMELPPVIRRKKVSKEGKKEGRLYYMYVLYLPIRKRQQQTHAPPQTLTQPQHTNQQNPQPHKPKTNQLPVEVDLGRSIGRISIVETPPILPNEPTLFARRKGRVRPSRVVLTADSLVRTYVGARGCFGLRPKGKLQGSNGE